MGWGWVNNSTQQTALGVRRDRDLQPGQTEQPKDTLSPAPLLTPAQAAIPLIVVLCVGLCFTCLRVQPILAFVISEGVWPMPGNGKGCRNGKLTQHHTQPWK